MSCNLRATNRLEVKCYTWALELGPQTQDQAKTSSVLSMSTEEEVASVLFLKSIQSALAFYFSSLKMKHKFFFLCFDCMACGILVP